MPGLERRCRLANGSTLHDRRRRGTISQARIADARTLNLASTFDGIDCVAGVGLYEEVGLADDILGTIDETSRSTRSAP